MEMIMVTVFTDVVTHLQITLRWDLKEVLLPTTREFINQIFHTSRRYFRW